MIDEKLRKKMEKAYDAGNYKKALHLSQKLDTQIVIETKTRIPKQNLKIKPEIYPQAIEEKFSPNQMIKYLDILILVIAVFLFTSTNAYAAGNLFDNAQSLLNDVYAKFVGFSTAAAGIGVGTGVFMRKFSLGKQHQIELGGKIIKDSIIGWGVLNSVGLILSYISNYTK